MSVGERLTCFQDGCRGRVYQGFPAVAGSPLAEFGCRVATTIRCPYRRLVLTAGDLSAVVRPWPDEGGSRAFPGVQLVAMSSLLATLALSVSAGVEPDFLSVRHGLVYQR